MEYIASQENLEAFVRRAASSSVLAIDTEFLREKTYYANLCLIQLATDAEVAVVDPFAIEDMKVLAPLLTDSSIVKLFHAGGQDLEILYRELGVLPAPLFDTQVAATLLGHTQQIGYGPLVHSLCGVNLKKSDSFTDWSRRPLSTSQLEYAADDVIYLPKMYRIMVEKLEAKGRLHWLDNDFAAMSDPAHYESDPFERYKRLKRVGQLTRRQLSAAREVACWREVTAQERDMPRKWVLTDEQIVAACKAVGLHHYIMSLPNGYDTVLDDKASLSQGQRQLLTIARAMVEDAPILILDEATSSVDTRTEELIQKAMDALTVGRTSFVIAHRLSTIRDADMILVMNGGDIVERGTHEELLAKGGFYADIYNSQFTLAE